MTSGPKCNFIRLPERALVDQVRRCVQRIGQRLDVVEGQRLMRIAQVLIKKLKIDDR